MARVYYDGYSGREGEILPVPCRNECEKTDVCECKSNENDVCECEKNECPTDCSNSQKNSLFGFDSFLPNLRLDDIILLGIVLVMLHDGTDDKLLLVIIGIIFLLGFDSPAAII